MAKKKLELLFSKCESCGDDMIFDAEGQCLLCPSCKMQKAISKTVTYAKHTMDSSSLMHHSNNDWLLINKTLNCTNCGAEITVNGFDITAWCPYCNTSMLFKSVEKWGVQPDAIIPFTISKNQAGEIFKEKIQKKWLTPKKLKKNLKLEKIEAFYYPSFVFGAICMTRYDATVYDEERYTDKDGFTRTNRKYYHKSGLHNSQHKDVIVEASTKLTLNEVEMVRPYDFSKAVDFSNDYLFGYQVECYSSSVKDSFGYADVLIHNEIRRQITSDLRRFCDGVSKLDVDVVYNHRDYYYCFLPIYRTSFKYKNETYTNVVNGQTGVFGGKIPKSGLKIATIILLPILAITLIVLLSLLI